jgi:CBS domain-containing protein
MSGILDARPRVGYFYTGKTRYQVVSEAIGEIKVRDVKSRPAVIKEDTTVYQAIVTLFLEDTGSLFVVKEDGSLSGVISRKDLLKSVMSQGDFNKVPVGIIMTRMPNIVTITEDASLLEAAIKINEREVDSIPVVKQEGNRAMVVGKISKTNIARVFVELGKEGYRGNNL